jgi:geranylgeranyl reductase family protein
MKNKKAKVLIIGAGPAGSACACALAMRGLEEIVIVDKSSFPRRKPCAGGLGPGTGNWLDAIGLREKVMGESNLITGLKAVTPSGREMHIGGVTAAHVLPREKFDTILLHRAEALGAEVITGERVTSLLGSPGAPRGAVTETGRRIEAIWTVAASGGGSKLLPRTSRGFATRVLKSVIARYEGMEVDSRSVEMYFDRDIRPLYGWVFPEGGNVANVGLCYDRSRLRGMKPKEAFSMFTERYLRSRLRDAKRTSPLAGAPIFTSFDPDGIAAPGLLVAGEAGGLVNPATGEGIRQALRSGVWAADAIADHLAGRLSARDAARKYELRIKTGLGPGLVAGELLRFATPALLDLAALLTNLRG